MDPGEADDHLSRMATNWSALFRAHGEDPVLSEAARRELLERYRSPIYRYLLGATRDPNRGDDLFQEFALKFIRGDFRRANPERGRFRDFLKTALYHLLIDENNRRRPLPLTEDVPLPSQAALPDLDEAFYKIWREELFQRAWAALEAEEQGSGQPVFTVLRFRTDHPDLKSHQVAEQLAPRFHRPLSAEWVRKWLHRARRRFAMLLVEDVARSLESPSRDDLEEEFRDLNLSEVYREAFGSAD